MAEVEIFLVHRTTGQRGKNDRACALLMSSAPEDGARVLSEGDFAMSASLAHDYARDTLKGGLMARPETEMCPVAAFCTGDDCNVLLYAQNTLPARQLLSLAHGAETLQLPGSKQGMTRIVYCFAIRCNKRACIESTDKFLDAHARAVEAKARMPPELRLDACEVCNKIIVRKDRLQCQRCKRGSLCSKECFATIWETHKVTCHD